MPRRLAAVLALSLLLAACADPPARTAARAPDRQTHTVAPRPPTGSDVVPWLNQPAPPYKPAPPTRPKHDAPPCRAGDLRASASRPGFAMGISTVTVTFLNHAARTCVLLGHPVIAAVTSRGRTVELNPRFDAGPAPDPAANLRTGQRSLLYVGGWDDCAAAGQGRHRRYPTLRVHLPAGGTVEVPAHGLDFVCGSWVSRFGSPPPGDEAPPLTVSLHVSPTIRAARTLHYTVTLRNRTARAFSLRPCPSYQEYLFAPPQAAVQGNYRLNCATVHSIPAHASVTYAMQLPLPRVTGTHPVEKFGWMLNGPLGVAAATAGQELRP